MSEYESQEWLVLSKQKNHYKYNRSNSTQVESLSDALKKLYGVDACVITPSGMAAISTLFHSLLVEDVFNLVYSNELYSDTPKLIQFLSKIYNIKSFQIDVTKPKEILDLFRGKDLQGKNNILFVESSSNPSGLMMDNSIIPDLKKYSKKLVYVVDNTWLSCASYNPFSEKADFVVNSLTKYYSAGSAIGGCILSDKTNIDRVITWICMNGMHVSPYNALEILKNVSSLEERVMSSSDLTLKVLEKIQGHKKIVELHHPSLKNHPSYKLTKRLKYFPSCFTITVKSSKSKIMDLMQNSKYIEHKTSFGANKSRTDPWPKATKDHMTFRISIGFADDLETVCKGILEILDKLN